MLSMVNFSYSADQIKDALHGRRGVRQLNFHYYLLDKEERKIGELDCVRNGEISMDSLASIKRSAKFNIKDNGEINWLSDRIQPWAKLKIDTDKYIDIPLGVFLLSSPTRRDENNIIYRDVQAYDGLLVLKDDKFPVRHILSQGTNYIGAVKEILYSAGITKINFEETDKTLSKEMMFDPGTEKLQAVNTLLAAINYTPIHVDVYGFYKSFPYRIPSERAPEYTYKDDSLSIVYSGMSEELDLGSVPNRWVVVRSNSDQEPISSIFTNDNPNSPLSTVTRGRTITDNREIDDIADQESLDAYTQRIAFEASQIYGKIDFETAVNPFHDYNDVFNLQYSPLGINDKYSETNWTIPLSNGSRMKHSVRKVLSI